MLFKLILVCFSFVDEILFPSETQMQRPSVSTQFDAFRIPMLCELFHRQNKFDTRFFHKVYFEELASPAPPPGCFGRSFFRRFFSKRLPNKISSLM